MLIILLLTIILIIFIIYKYNKKQDIEGLYTFNGRMSIEDQWFHDNLFDNVYYFPNKYAQPYETGEEIGKLLDTGLAKCLQECPGNCMEYGVSGRAYCFLPDKNWTT